MNLFVKVTVYLYKFNDGLRHDWFARIFLHGSKEIGWPVIDNTGRARIQAPIVEKRNEQPQLDQTWYLSRGPRAAEALET